MAIGRLWGCNLEEALETLNDMLDVFDDQPENSGILDPEV
jgi:hypothetical protein